MKKIIFTFIFLFSIAVSAFCGGIGEMELVNSQEIRLNNIKDISVFYSSENISVFPGNSNNLVIHEYMTVDNSRYYAVIGSDADSVVVRKGRSPNSPFFRRRVEIFIPGSYLNALKIRTSSGVIETSDLINSKISLETSSGNISVKSVKAGIIEIKSSSGRINIGAANGEAAVSTSSGNIDLKLTGGTLNARSSSGGINCTVDGNAGDLSFVTSSGSVRLNLPRNFQFNFSSRSSSGRLTAPFSDRLSHPFNNKNLTQGVIHNDTGSLGAISDVNIRTASGSIAIEWI